MSSPAKYAEDFDRQLVAKALERGVLNRALDAIQRMAADPMIDAGAREVHAMFAREIRDGAYAAGGCLDCGDEVALGSVCDACLYGIAHECR